eukprot:1145852-Pelagomonas_calceolata.AAC.2
MCWIPSHALMWACRVELVLIGAEAVVENGGVINKLGSYQTAICAKALNKPVYVAVESYKFARLYPLGQRAAESLPTSKEEEEDKDNVEKVYHLTKVTLLPCAMTA